MQWVQPGEARDGLGELDAGSIPAAPTGAESGNSALQLNRCDLPKTVHLKLDRDKVLLGEIDNDAKAVTG